MTSYKLQRCNCKLICLHVYIFMPITHSLMIFLVNSFLCIMCYICLCATGSSLWEIDTLRHHYSPAVSRYRNVTSCPDHYAVSFVVCSFSCGTLRFVASLEEDLTVRAKTTEMKITDFSSGSYATVFRDEVHLHYLSTFHLMHCTAIC